MPFSPTDANGYLGPPATVNTNSPNYPRYLYHPTKGSLIVVDTASEAALMASDIQWTETNPNATT